MIDTRELLALRTELNEMFGRIAQDSFTGSITKEGPVHVDVGRFWQRWWFRLVWMPVVLGTFNMLVLRPWLGPDLSWGPVFFVDTIMFIVLLSLWHVLLGSTCVWLLRLEFDPRQSVLGCTTLRRESTWRGLLLERAHEYVNYHEVAEYNPRFDPATLVEHFVTANKAIQTWRRLLELIGETVDRAVAYLSGWRSTRAHRTQVLRLQQAKQRLTVRTRDAYVPGYESPEWKAKVWRPWKRSFPEEEE